MGKLTKIVYPALIFALIWCACSVSTRYFGTSTRGDSPSGGVSGETASETPPIGHPNEEWPDLAVLHSDEAYLSVDTASANRASRYRWADVVEILEHKGKISVIEGFLLARAYLETGDFASSAELSPCEVGDEALFRLGLGRHRVRASAPREIRAGRGFDRA